MMLDFMYQFTQVSLWLWMQHLLWIAKAHYTRRDKISAKCLHHLSFIYHANPHRAKAERVIRKLLISRR